MCRCYFEIEVEIEVEVETEVETSLIASFYSTVTDFAKLRGWSTSVPLLTAVW